MKVHVAVCTVSLRGEKYSEVLGVYRTQLGARIKLGEDETSNHLGAHSERMVVVVELEG